MMETSIITQGGTKATISRPITMAFDWQIGLANANDGTSTGNYLYYRPSLVKVKLGLAP